MPSDVAGTRARSRRPSPRERLLKAADELFYAEGINSVGIDRVIERADVARASLYSTFGSKDGLIRAYLEQRMEITKARLRAAAEAHDDPRDALLSVFGVQAANFARPGFQGCAFNRASAEAPPGSAAYEVSRAYRRWLHDFLRDLAAAAGVPDPDQLASQIHLLYDGAMLAASLDGSAGVAAASRSAAEALLDSAQLNSALLHSAAFPGPSSGRHRKQEQSVVGAGLHV
jgi:AcrR family transcriptional regulator